MQQYLQQTESSSIVERRLLGLVWYPIAIRGTELSRGDYLTVEAERTNYQEVPHQFKSGASAVFFSNHDPKNSRVEGVIGYLNGNRLKITLKTDDLPDWASDGKLGIELLFDNNSYEEIEKALKLAIKLAEQSPKPRLLEVIAGDEKPSFTTVSPVQIEGLNSRQEEAVARMLAANELAIIHGPPGTGKTTTLIKGIQALIEKGEEQILVTAPSNTAVDLLTEKLAECGLNVIRIGNPARVSDKLTALTLDAKVNLHPNMKDTRKLKKQSAEYIQMAHKYKRNFGRAEREQRKALFDEAYKIQKEINQIEQFITDDLLSRAQIITATLVGTNHFSIRNRRYKTVVIDEAGQALEPATWIPVLKSDKVILAGDHFQLPPTIKSEEAASKGLEKTLLEKLAQKYPEAVVMLEEQYRMNSLIMNYPSSVFYGGKLKASELVSDHVLFTGDSALLYIDTAGCGFNESKENSSLSNPEEASFLINQFKEHRQLMPPDSSVGIISPYREQALLLKKLVNEDETLAAFRGNISINTIDSFQGQERDVIYISMTRSNTDSSIGFLSDIRRMNVAMTRARKKLIVIGDSVTLARLPFYANFIAYTESINAYHSAWEFMG